MIAAFLSDLQSALLLLLRWWRHRCYHTYRLIKPNKELTRLLRDLCENLRFGFKNRLTNWTFVLIHISRHNIESDSSRRHSYWHFDDVKTSRQAISVEAKFKRIDLIKVFEINDSMMTSSAYFWCYTLFKLTSLWQPVPHH